MKTISSYVDGPWKRAALWFWKLANRPHLDKQFQSKLQLNIAAYPLGQKLLLEAFDLIHEDQRAAYCQY